MASSTERNRRLFAFFKAALVGDRPISSSRDARLFVQAICNENVPSTCAEKIISSSHGLESLSTCVRVDLSAPFVTECTLPLLNYFSHPGIKDLDNGLLLQQLLVALASPPTLWKCLIQLHAEGAIPEEGLRPFMWLLSELLQLSPKTEIDVLEDGREVMARLARAQSTDQKTRELGYKIKNLLDLRTSTIPISSSAHAPGGRHDNDFADFRQIAIYPTTDEFHSTQTPYYLTTREVFDADEDSRASVHLDNQFRMLREDLLGELREDFHVATGRKKGAKQGLVLGGLRPTSLDFGDEQRVKPCCLRVTCNEGLDMLKNKSDEQRKKFWDDHPSFLKHQSFGVLCRGQDIFGFAFVDRDTQLLAQRPPVVALRFVDHRALCKTLLAFKTLDDIKLVLVNTPVFAYEPVLERLKEITELPFQEVLVNPSTLGTSEFSPGPRVLKAIDALRCVNKDKGGNAVLPSGQDDGSPLYSNSGRLVTMDESQLESLIGALGSSVAPIVGPPGTGKSFTGAYIAKYLYELTDKRILVLGYTNHAVDQFAGDMMEAGIPMSAMLRLGSKAKCAPSVAPMLMIAQNLNFRRSRETWLRINNIKDDAQGLAGELHEAFARFVHTSDAWDDVEGFLEFSPTDQRFYDALKVPAADSNWFLAGRKGKQAGPDFLYLRWKRGEDAGPFKHYLPREVVPIWTMPKDARHAQIDRWRREMAEERLETLQELLRQFHNHQKRMETMFSDKDVATLKTKRVICCTTTGAAKYAGLLRNANPDVILVEEAGEILESHILAAMTPSVKQLILIGDHKQLRPKVNNYNLSVEKGDGYDLNRSLFERLILRGAPHTTLSKQHRMATEISVFPRKMTYPDLLDGAKTSGRPAIRGLRDRVVFVNHSKPETQDNKIFDRRDPDTKASKTNAFEAELVLRCVQYLGQQGYSTENIVVLTPYLGQLRLLQQMLGSAEMRTALGDMDRADLIRAGLLTAAAAKLNQQPLRLSTVDNYQGEESDIVIASLTRSNATGDIGFMKAPERLNVLLTRARNGLVLIGNMETFTKSPKGKETWLPFFEILKSEEHLYDGFPIQCERHLTSALPREPGDFDICCPDGGCAEPCMIPLKCQLHNCPRRCHRLDDHSQVECSEMVTRVCDRQHKVKIPCHERSKRCRKCIFEDNETERRVKRDLQLEMDRQSRQAAYKKDLQELQDELDHQRRMLKYQQEDEEQKRTLAQHRDDLAALKDTAARIRRQKTQEAAASTAAAAGAGDGAGASAPDNDLAPPGSANEEWRSLKQLEMAQSPALDKLMDMIGLEEVKQEFLSIKNKVDTAVRQGISLTKERFSCSLLGNPGTGKTTVARLYAEFLTSVGVIPGTRFEETTGAGLASSGVSGCKKLVDEMLNDGGGVLFIDEAYQLTSGNSHGGGGVLDYLLPEVENLTGKIVFVLAGYNKQMETFFAHNPGLPSRFPIEMKFADYTEDELLRILELKINKKYAGRMTCDGGLRGLYCKIVARRIGGGRGKDGFGNARTVENTLATICRRQADRLRKERRDGKKSDDLFLTKEDLIGPEPCAALARCKPWEKLQSLIGLSGVKEAVRSLVDSIQENYQRELAEQPPIKYSLNKVFLGSPGTGKTTVAKLYGEILAELGLLSKGEVVVKNPADFVGGALGQSEQQTKGILAATTGKVLVIDEAHGLYPGSGTSDPYKLAVIDTIVAEVQSVPGDDRCVLLLGYKDQMEDMFQNSNPGLARRFPVASGFTFEDFSEDELRLILDMKLKAQGFTADEKAKNTAMAVLGRARNRPNFGNAGEVDILLDTAKAQHQGRVSQKMAKPGSFDAVDFDEDFDRAERVDTDVRLLFAGTVGSEATVALLQGYQASARARKKLDMDPRKAVPFNFLFRGPPGTGKTTTARKMGKVFYDMGFLAAAKVVERSATDLIGQYVGQTGPKVVNLLDSALGRVLFVDEAYRLAGGGGFAKEAVDELVDCTTKERYHQKLVIILAGYEDDINQLMAANTGLTSRFPAVVDFRALTAGECVDLLAKLLADKKKELQGKGNDLDVVVLAAPEEEFRVDMTAMFETLVAQDSWASARDVKTLAEGIFDRTIKVATAAAGGSLTVTQAAVMEELRAMMLERKGRSKSAKAAAAADGIGDLMQLVKGVPTPQARSQTTAATATKTTAAASTHTEQQGAPDPVPTASEEEEPRSQVTEPSEATPPQTYPVSKRDAGVSDAVWEQLQRDKMAEEAREQEYQLLLEAKKRSADQARDDIVRRLIEEERRRRKEAEARKKLEREGLCPAGFDWIRQAGGYRCAGGSHFVGDEVLSGM